MKKKVFIGRKKEIEQLEKALTETTKGNGKLILIKGSAGAGKSGIVQEFLTQHRQSKNVLIGVSECNDKENLNAYAPFKDILIQLNTNSEKKDTQNKFKKFISEAGTSWIELIPIIGSYAKVGVETYEAYKKTYDTKTTSKVESENDIYRIFENEFKRLATDKTVIIFIDDLQWSDASSLNLLFALGKLVRSTPIKLLIIGSYRPNEIKVGRTKLSKTGNLVTIRHPFADKLNELRNYCKTENHIVNNNWFKEIKLQPFTKIETENLINQKFTSNSFDNNFIDKIYKLTNGHPLYANEILNYLLRNSIIENIDGVYSAKHFELNDLPVSLNGVISEKVERLNENLKMVLTCASVNGEEFSAKIIEKILKIDELNLLTYLEELTQKHSLLVEGEPIRIKNMLFELYSFSQTLVHKFLYENMDNARRRLLHRRIAATIKELYGDDLIETSKEVKQKFNYHNQIGLGLLPSAINSIDENEQEKEDTLEKPKATLFLEAAESEIQNAEDSFKIYAVIECYDFIDKALAFLSKVNDDNLEKQILKFEAILLKSKVLQWQGHYQKSLEVAKVLIELSKKIPNKKFNAEANLASGMAKSKLGYGKEAIAFFNNSIAYYITTNNTCSLWKSYYESAKTKIDIAAYNKALDLLKKALVLSEKIDDISIKGRTLLSIGECSSKKWLDDAVVMKYFNEALEIFKNSKDDYWIGQTYSKIGLEYNSKSKYNLAEEFLIKALIIAKEQNDTVNISNYNNNLALIYSGKNEYDLAIEYYNKTLAIDQMLDDKPMIAKSIRNIGTVYVDKEEYQTAIQYFNEALDTIKDLNNPAELASSYYLFANAYDSMQKKEEAIEYYQKAIEINLTINDTASLSGNYYMLGNIYYNYKDYEMASNYLLKALKLLLEIGNILFISAANNLLGLIEKAKGNYKLAIEYFNTALKDFKDLNNIYSIADVEDSLGSVYSCLNDYDNSIIHFKEAVIYAERNNDKSQLSYIYKNIASEYYNNNDYQNSITYYKEAIAINTELNKENELVNNYKYLGFSYYYSSQYQLAIEAYLKELQLNLKFQEIEDIANCFFNLGLANYFIDLNEKALEYNLKALDYFKKLDYKLDQSRVYKNIGNCYQYLDNPDLVIENYEKAIAIAEQLNEKEHLSNLFSVFGNYYYLLKNYKNSIDLYKKATILGIELNLKEELAIDFKFLGFNYFFSDENELAIASFKKQLELELELNDVQSLSDCYDNLGLAYYWNNQYNDSIENYKKALNIRKNSEEANENIEKTYFNLSRSYHFNKQFEEAINYQIKALELTNVKFGENSPEVDNINFAMAQTYYFANLIDLAKKALHLSIEFRKKHYGDNSDELNEALEFYNNFIIKQTETTIEGKSAPTQGTSIDSNNSSTIEQELTLLTGYGDSNYDNQQYDDALNNYLNALDFINKLSDGTLKKEELAIIHYKLGMTYKCLKNFKIARGCFITSTNGFLKNYGPKNAYTARSYSYLGDIYYYLNEYKNAINCHSEALKSFSSIEDSVMSTWSHHDLGEDYYWDDNYEKSIHHFKACLNLRIQQNGNEDKEVATTYYKIGRSYYWNEQYQLAILNQTKAYEIRKKLCGENAPETDEARYELGKEYYFANLVEVSKDYLFQTLNFRKEYFGDESPQYKSVNNWIEKYINS